MARISVGMDIPVAVCDFEASYSRVEKLTGVQFLLLKVIGTGSFGGMTWGEVMDRMQIPEELFEIIFKRALGRLVLLKMIDVNGSMELDDEIGNISFTKLGEQAFRRGVIAEDVEPFRGTVAYSPASTVKYSKASSVPLRDADEVIRNRFVDVSPNDYEVENHVIRRKMDYGVDDESADVFDFRMDGDYTLRMMHSTLDLELNPTTGDFVATNDSLDLNYLKGVFSSEDILSSIPEGHMSAGSGVSIRSWRSTLPDWKSMTFMMPSDIRLNGAKIVLCNKTSVDVHGSHTMDLDGCDMVTIDTSQVGYEYAFVQRDVSVSGFPGTSGVRMMVRRTIGPERIAEYLRAVIDASAPSDIDGLSDVLDMAGILGDAETTSRIVSDYIGRSQSIGATVKDLKRFSKAGWYRDIGIPAIRSLNERGMDVRDIAKELSGTGLMLDPGMLADVLGTGVQERDMVIADVFEKMVKDHTLLINSLGLSDFLVDMVLDGKPMDSESRILASVSNMSRTLARLKDAIGIRSLSDYSIDLEFLMKTDDDRGLSSDLSTFLSDLSITGNVLKRSRRYGEICGYESFLKDVNSLLNDVKGTTDRGFAITLCVRLEAWLNGMGFSGNLVEMLEGARSENLISEMDHRQLNELREYRNKCAHSLEVPKLDSKKRKMWSKLVDRIAVDREDES